VLPTSSATWSPTLRPTWSPTWSEQDLQESEKEGLRELCTALGGPSALGPRWAGLYNDTLYSSPCTWNGLIECEHRPIGIGEPHVVGISLKRGELTGTIPNSLPRHFTFLQSLDLSYNSISGTIPAGFVCDPNNPDGASKNMQYFDVESNRLSGTLPSDECLANRSSGAQLRLFSASNNLISGTIPAGFVCDPNNPDGASKNMQQFVVKSNRLSGTLPSDECLGSRSSLNPSPLIRFSASDTIVSGHVPSSLFNLGSDEVSEFNDKGVLVLAKCRLSGTIPADLEQVTRTDLKIIDLSQNDLSGNIPDLTRTFPNLTILSLSSNRDLKGRLDSLPMASLQYLLIDGTRLNGDLDALGSMIAPKKIHLAGNQLSGTIPEALFLHPSLEEFVLSHNRVSGSLPNTVGSALGLKKLLLDTNRIQGRLPDTLADVLPVLRDIRLNLNQMSCEIPTGLQQTGVFDSTNGTGGGVSTPAVQIVQGNMFGCRGIETLREVDAYGKAYQCGYSAFLVPFIVSVVMGALVVEMGVWHVYRKGGIESSNWKLLWSWVQTR